MTNNQAYKPALVVLCAAVIALAGCGGQSHYRNTVHPDYGPAQLSKDQDECQRANAHVVTTAANYVETTRTVVDQDKADACLAARGWQRTQN